MANLRRRYLIIAMVVLILITLSSSQFVHSSKQIERRESKTQVFVEEVIPLSKSSLMATIEKSLDKQFHELALIKKDSKDGQIFPSDYAIKYCCPNEAALQEYIAIDEKLREKDYYLYNVGDVYWSSEYYYNGTQAMFGCNFIIHLQPIGDSKTNIRVVEAFPKIQVGEKFYLLGRAGPGFYNETKMVEQTIRDRVELIDLIKTLLAK